MLVEKDSLSDNSKIYIFPANRKLYPKEIPLIQEKMESFLKEISKIDLAFEMQYDRFLILIVSHETPLNMEQSDALVNLILQLEKEYKITLLDKVNVCFKQGEYVQLKEMNAFKKLIKSKGVSKKTIVFNNLITTKSEYDCCWETPAEDSWISHYF
jgi:hypothetical protein